jgi:hypothetical protein
VYIYCTQILSTIVVKRNFSSKDISGIDVGTWCSYILIFDNGIQISVYPVKQYTRVMFIIIIIIIISIIFLLVTNTCRQIKK